MNFVASSKQDIEQEQRRKQDQIRTIKYDVRRMIEDQMKKGSHLRNFLQLFVYINHSIIRLSSLSLIAVASLRYCHTYKGYAGAYILHIYYPLKRERNYPKNHQSKIYLVNVCNNILKCSAGSLLHFMSPNLFLWVSSPFMSPKFFLAAPLGDFASGFASQNLLLTCNFIPLVFA